MDKASIAQTQSTRRLEARAGSALAGRSASPAAGEATGPGSIALRNVSYTFANAVLAIENVSFTVAPGEFVAIVGPSGCGKTTVQNIIAGLLPQQGGEVLVGGREPKAGRKDVGYMFAQDALLPWRTVLGNSLFGQEIHTGRDRPPPSVLARAREILASINLADFETAYPRQLSHGMRQRVALARTFMMDSPILLMDEPFGALDAHTKLTLENVLLRLWESSRRTVLFITHDLAESILLADRILVCSARPARIKSDVVVDLPRPRAIGELQRSDHYHALYQRIWADLAEEMNV